MEIMRAAASCLNQDLQDFEDYSGRRWFDWEDYY